MSFIEKIIKPFAPHLCIICSLEGAVLCESCRISTLVPRPSVCFLCNSITQDFRVCKKCIHNTKLSAVWSASDYDGVVKKVIRSYKYSPARAASEVLADIMVDSLPLIDCDLITHIPTATSRVRYRGFDHAELLAQMVARRLQLPHRRLLGRINQAKQVGSSRKQRIAQAEAAFRICTNPRSFNGTRILIVDDVVSTGATLIGASNVLKKAGAARVSAAVVAHNKGR